MNPWDNIISAEEQQAYRAAGFGRRSGLGQRPALLIIDVQYRTSGTRPMPFAEAVQEFPSSCGESAWQAIANIETVLKKFRERNWPVLYAYVAPKKASEGGRLAEKVPAIMGVSAKGYDFVEAIKPAEADVLLPKKHPSAFFGTALASHLVDLQADTLVIAGCTTSGCIRSSVVDAFSLNYRVYVPHDCVYDRGKVSHAVSLFDMSQKYADVGPSTELLQLLKEV